MDREGTHRRARGRGRLEYTGIKEGKVLPEGRDPRAHAKEGQGQGVNTR